MNNQKIAHTTATTELREKISTDLGSL